MLASLLPRDFSDESNLSLYEQTPPTPVKVEEGKSTEHAQKVPGNKLQEVKQRKLVRLRNLLLDVLMSHFTTERNEFDVK